ARPGAPPPPRWGRGNDVVRICRARSGLSEPCLYLRCRIVNCRAFCALSRRERAPLPWEEAGVQGFAAWTIYASHLQQPLGVATQNFALVLRRDLEVVHPLCPRHVLHEGPVYREQ